MAIPRENQGRVEQIQPEAAIYSSPLKWIGDMVGAWWNYCTAVLCVWHICTYAHMHIWEPIREENHYPFHSLLILSSHPVSFPFLLSNIFTYRNPYALLSLYIQSLWQFVVKWMKNKQKVLTICLKEVGSALRERDNKVIKLRFLRKIHLTSSK